jgi:hypothetical protein
MVRIGFAHDDGGQAVNVKRTSRRGTEIDHPTVHEWSAIVDAHHHRAAVAAIDDGHLRAEWQRAVLVEFVSGNMLFVLLHEMAHVSITQMGLPVLGRTEDAADNYAALRLIRSGSNFSHRVLIEAAEGWFMADRRDQKVGDKLAYYDEHGLNQQRAYQIVCLMVGSDDEKFKDLARETKLPEERRDPCAGDYSNAAYSWDLVLEPHRRVPDQPKTNIDVIYGPAEGRASTAQQVAQSIRLSETVAEHAADEFSWPAPFTLEMQSCGYETPANPSQS